MVGALNLTSDPNEIGRALQNAQGWNDIFAGGEIDLDKLPPELRRKIEAKKSELLEDGGELDQIDTESEVRKFAELLGTEMDNIPGLPTGFDPQLLIDWILNKQQEQNQPAGGNTAGAHRGQLGGQQFQQTQPASFNNTRGGGGGSTGTGTAPSGGSSGTPDAAVGPVQVSGKAADIMQRMQQIDQMGLPYVFGGGHNGQTNSVEACRNIGGLDCSGSVSAALGIPTRVSGQFGSVGNAQPGADWKGVTVYYNDGHVLMSIKGDDGKDHFWGTSRSNPNGGPGWIDNPGADYLSDFQTRYV